MPGRMAGPGAWSPLEWGEASTMPRSNVRDADAVLVFTGSPVVAADDAERVGRVTKLIAVDRISVQWEGAHRPQQVAARFVRVTGPFRSAKASDQRPNAWTGLGWRVDPFGVLGGYT